MTDSATIAAALLRAGAVLLRPQHPFTFASGLRSPIYCDNRLLLGAVAERRAVTTAFVRYSEGAEALAGPATGAIPWVAWAAEALSLPMAYVRASAKGHGRARQIEGAPVMGRRVVLLEDTISTGESALAAAEALREGGASLLRCVCIFTWGWETTAAAFQAAALPLQPLTTLPALLDAAEERLSAGERALVEAWVTDPQGWSREVERAEAQARPEQRTLSAQGSGVGDQGSGF